MRVNWNGIDEAQNFGPAPAGTYLCRVVEAKAATTRYNDDMWKLTLEIADGRYKGKQIWDNVVFSQNAMPRAKLICRSFGLPTEGETDIFPEDLRGHEAYVTVEIEDYVNNEGVNRQRNSVTFGGYASPEDVGTRSVRSEPESASTVDDDIPFVVTIPILLSIVGGLLA